MSEARDVTSIAQRIAAILLLGPALDGGYQAAKQAPYAWPAAARQVEGTLLGGSP